MYWLLKIDVNKTPGTVFNNSNVFFYFLPSCFFISSSNCFSWCTALLPHLSRTVLALLRKHLTATEITRMRNGPQVLLKTGPLSKPSRFHCTYLMEPHHPIWLLLDAAQEAGSIIFSCFHCLPSCVPTPWVWHTGKEWCAARIQVTVMILFC